MNIRYLRLFPAVSFVLIIILIALPASGQQKAVIDTESNIDVKADSLSQLMTLEEKIGQIPLFTKRFDDHGSHYSI